MVYILVNSSVSTEFHKGINKYQYISPKAHLYIYHQQ